MAFLAPCEPLFSPDNLLPLKIMRTGQEAHLSASGVAIGNGTILVLCHISLGPLHKLMVVGDSQ